MKDTEIKGNEKESYVLTVTGRGREVKLTCCSSESLLDSMVRQGIYLSAACAGRGTCGKCKLRLIEGTLAVTDFDRAKLTAKELEQGYRLSCKAFPVSDCTIQLVTGNEADFEVVADFQALSHATPASKEDYVIAIDIGTTTIAVSLVTLSGEKSLWTYTAVNRQRAYGADVIARIQASNGGKREALKESIQRDLLTGIRSVIEKTGVAKEQVRKVAIAGNTTMGHLLLGYSCETLGVYPFTPVNISEITLPFEEVLDSDYLKIPVVLLPGISTYVGGDISAGLLACDFDQTEATCLLIDLGTNGEMAIGNRNKIIVTSTAAGPAFEGGNITCGVGSVAGAICKINLGEEGVRFNTIGEHAPTGICGTGVIEMVSELLKAGLVDETGLLTEEYFEEGYPLGKDTLGKDIVFTQKDVREIQLAKAAVRAGVEILVRRYEINYTQIETVYLAGGFGYKMNIEKAIHIGLLPKELSGKIKAIGNSSLGGAVRYLTDPSAQERMEAMIGKAEEINLSNDKDFNDLYIDYMYFEE